ncbi:MAG: class II fructose-bisphosphate aldolase [Armatimonadetes bacterium]|nr:class II fructose-bisphosphate aldolase [Armatimonadota bacterium]
MPFVPMSELLAEAYAAGYAVPGFCVWCPEAMQTVLQVAREMRAPVILMNGPAEFPCLAPSTLAAAAHELIARYPAQAALHLDHGESLERVQQCLDAGYTSVMLDYSTRPLAENIAALREVCSLAHPLGVTVEGEIGVVGKVEASVVEGGEASALTDPAEAAEYVAATGVDALAVAIGNAHGQYARLPRLDFALLERLRQAVPVPLVLHGGSGTPDADLQRAIGLGIAKVNVATDLVAGVRESLLRQWQEGRNPWIPSAQAEAMAGMAGVVAGWIRRTGAAGRA